jgi:hypothetical protein
LWQQHSLTFCSDGHADGSPAGRAEKKLALARWSQVDFVAWDQKHPREIATLLEEIQRAHGWRQDASHTP